MGEKSSGQRIASLPKHIKSSASSNKYFEVFRFCIEHSLKIVFPSFLDLVDFNCGLTSVIPPKQLT